MAGRIVVVKEAKRTSQKAKFVVHIGDQKAGGLIRGLSQDFRVSAGEHRVRVSQSGYSSKPLVISVPEGETVVVRIHLRYWVNFLNFQAGGLIGAAGFWTAISGPSLGAAGLFVLGVGEGVAVFASKILIRLRADPVTG